MSDISWMPNFFIPGAPKSGTSSLQRWIADHPDAIGSKEKETYFLVDPGTHMYRPDFHVSNGIDQWKTQFSHVGDRKPRVVVESTPGYMYYNTALNIIPNLPSDPKCLFVLREPGAQIYSMFTYFRDNWRWIPSDMKFSEFVSVAKGGGSEFRGNELASNAFQYAAYVDYLSLWVESLGQKRMMVATFDDLILDNRGFTKKVAEWIGLDVDFYDEYSFPRENETYSPKNRALQSLNVMMRGRLPKGKMYNKAREIYRKLNTTRTPPSADEDLEIVRSVSSEFSKKNRELSDLFGLKLTDWPTE